MTGYDNLPPALTQTLSQHNIKVSRVISFSQRKGRWCVEGNCADGRKMLIKWDEENNYKFAASLAKEKSIYQSLSPRNYLAGFVDFDGILALAFLDHYETARKRLKENSFRDNHLPLIKMALFAWMDFTSDSEHLSQFCSFSVPEYKDEINKYLWTLMLSGPAGTQATRFQTLRNRAIYRVIHRAIKWTDKSEQPEAQVIHGDFHLNNVLCNEQGGHCVLIDFEDVSYGYRVLELAVFYAQVWRLKCGDKQLLRELDAFINQEILKDTVERKRFWKIARLYKIGIFFNRRFS